MQGTNASVLPSRTSTAWANSCCNVNVHTLALCKVCVVIEVQFSRNGLLSLSSKKCRALLQLFLSMIYNYILRHGFPTEILHPDQDEKRGESPCHASGHPREGTGDSMPFLSQLSPYNKLWEVTKLGRGGGAVWGRCVGGCRWGCSSLCWESPWPSVAKEV